MIDTSKLTLNSFSTPNLYNSAKKKNNFINTEIKDILTTLENKSIDMNIIIGLKEKLKCIADLSINNKEVTNKVKELIGVINELDENYNKGSGCSTYFSCYKNSDNFETKFNTAIEKLKNGLNDIKSENSAYFSPKKYAFNTNMTKEKIDEKTEVYMFKENPDLSKQTVRDDTVKLKENDPKKERFDNDKKTSVEFIASGSHGNVYAGPCSKTVKKIAKTKNDNYKSEDVEIQNHLLEKVNNLGIKDRVHPTRILKKHSGVLPYLPFPTLKNFIGKSETMKQSAIQQAADDLYKLNKAGIYLTDNHSENYMYDEEKEVLHFVDLDRVAVFNKNNERIHLPTTMKEFQRKMIQLETPYKLKIQNLKCFVESLTNSNVTIKDQLNKIIRPEYILQDTTNIETMVKTFIDKNPNSNYTDLFL